MEHFETLCYGFGLVVFADIELAAAFIADALGLRGIVQFVESRLAVGADEASGGALDDFFVGDVQIDDTFDFLAELFEHFVEHFRLFDCAGEAVENETLLGVGFLEAVFHHCGGHFVGDERALGDVRLGEVAEFRTLLDIESKQVSRGDLYDAQNFAEGYGSCAFAASRCA